jgi:SpoVK/Ycf46/Vps4 family AAA+-type ATPase
VSTSRSQLYRLARDLGEIEAVEHGYSRAGLSGAAKEAAQREARRVIYRDGNRQINRFVRAVGLGPRRR